MEGWGGGIGGGGVGVGDLTLSEVLPTFTDGIIFLCARMGFFFVCFSHFCFLFP